MKDSKTRVGITAPLPLVPFTGQLNTITNTITHQISTNDILAPPLQILFETPGTLATPPLFFEEEEAADMRYSVDTVDGGVRGYGCVDGGG